MAKVRQRDTAAELALRKALHASGLRFRVQLPVPNLRQRTIDIAFTRARVAIFVDGCFWHGCPLHATQPKTNAAWWQAKIEGNRRRDENTNQVLAAADWVVIRVWEHESINEAVETVCAALQTRAAGGS